MATLVIAALARAELRRLDELDAAAGQLTHANACSASECSGPKTYTALVDLLLGDYDPTMRPSLTKNCTGRPEAYDVRVSFEVTAIPFINERLQKIEVAGFLALEWLDERLAFNGTAAGGCFDSVFVQKKLWDHVWIPDVYVENAVRTQFGSGFVRIAHDGTVRSSRRVLLDLECPMAFGHLPFDEQVCARCPPAVGHLAIEVSSSGHGAAAMDLPKLACC